MTLKLYTVKSRAADQSTEMRFASFFSGGFITVIVVNPPEWKLPKRTSVQSTIHVQRSQNIGIKTPLHKQSEMC